MTETGERAKGSAESRNRPRAPLSDLARVLAKKLSAWQALVAILVLIVALVIVQVSASPQAGAVIWPLVAVLAIGEAAALLLHRMDGPLRAKGLSEADVRAVCATLERTRKDVAAELEMDERRCRANVFGQAAKTKRLQIVGQLMANMGESVEWDISMPVGQGAVGVAWKLGVPRVVLLPPEGDEALSPEETLRVDPKLKWIISVPIKVDGKVRWMFNVDGEEARDRADLEEALRVARGAEGALVPFAARA